MENNKFLCAKTYNVCSYLLCKRNISPSYILVCLVVFLLLLHTHSLSHHTIPSIEALNVYLCSISKAQFVHENIHPHIMLLSLKLNFITSYNKSLVFFEFDLFFKKPDIYILSTGSKLHTRLIPCANPERRSILFLVLSVLAAS